MSRSRASLVVLAAGAVLLAGCSSTTNGGGGAATPVPTSTSPATVAGTFVYIPPSEAESDGRSALQLWTPTTGAVKDGAKLPGIEALSSTTVSPDGRRIAYIHASQPPGTGDVTVADLATGGNAKTLVKGEDLYCVEPTWSGEGTRVIAETPPHAGRLGAVDVTSGTFTPFPFTFAGCHVMWSGDGKTLAYANGEGSVIVTNVDGSNRHEIPRLGKDGGPTRRRSSDLVSLSADGKYLALFVNSGDNPDGDVARGLIANEIIDTTTGATMSLRVNGELQSAVFLPKGGLVVRTKIGDTMTVTALAADFTVLASAVEPMQLATAILIGYGAA